MSVHLPVCHTQAQHHPLLVGQHADASVLTGIAEPILKAYLFFLPSSKVQVTTTFEKSRWHRRRHFRELSLGRSWSSRKNRSIRRTNRKTFHDSDARDRTQVLLLRSQGDNYWTCWTAHTYHRLQINLPFYGTIKYLIIYTVTRNHVFGLTKCLHNVYSLVSISMGVVPMSIFLTWCF